MADPNHGELVSAIFVTFSGNCKKALTHYQTCFGGDLQFELFGKTLPGYTEVPVVNGSLVSDRIIIHGSDLVHNEGRTLGNHIAVFLHCKNADDRQALIGKLEGRKTRPLTANQDDQLIELTDVFDVRWVLGI